MPKKISAAQNEVADNSKAASQSYGWDPSSVDEKTDYSRWRLLDDHGRQTWHYLKTDKEVKEWPQSVADKHHLGLPPVRCSPGHVFLGDSNANSA